VDYNQCPYTDGKYIAVLKFLLLGWAMQFNKKHTHTHTHTHTHRPELFTNGSWSHSIATWCIDADHTFTHRQYTHYSLGDLQYFRLHYSWHDTYDSLGMFRAYILNTFRSDC
jgi:hypothetical protein